MVLYLGAFLPISPPLLAVSGCAVLGRGGVGGVVEVSVIDFFGCFVTREHISFDVNGKGNHVNRVPHKPNILKYVAESQSNHSIDQPETRKSTSNVLTRIYRPDIYKQ